MEDMLDSVKTTRYQIGTLSHMSEDIDTFLNKIRYFFNKVEAFFSHRSNAALVAAAIIASLISVNYLRAWFAVRIRWR
jgi:hypothetical protein